MSSLKVNNLTRAGGSGVPDLGGVAANRLLPTAWANFNGAGTVAIRDAYNVASVTDVAVGMFTLNLTTPSANTNYAVAGAVQRGDADYTTLPGLALRGTDAPPTVNTIPLWVGHINPLAFALLDPTIVGVIVFGGQA